MMLSYFELRARAISIILRPRSVDFLGSSSTFPSRVWKARTACSYPAYKTHLWGILGVNYKLSCKYLRSNYFL